ncbi:MAG: NADH-quinone oxidoreductase subunit H [Planctomycetaceae bacterium]|nr:NADH-quinone oxidoreductase subunit H [Planctomycetaceae bacterium]
MVEHLTAAGLAPWLALTVAIVVHAAFVLAFFGAVPAVAIWLERKVSGRIQDRLGPTRVGGKFGWLQGLADGIKAIQKEDIIPAAADSMLFRMAPYIANIAAFGGFMLLPFSRDWVAVAADIGLFILLAILSLEVVGIVMAGYASGSKWSLFGGIREAAQMVSYEIPLALCGLVPVLAAGSLNLSVIGEAQQGWFLPNWLIFHSPFAFVAFFVYFTVATAGSKRAPFDLAEAESELVGGFHTEYSTMRWVYFMLAEYGHMFLISGVAVLLFLGGWWIGLPFIDGPVAALRAEDGRTVEREYGRIDVVDPVGETATPLLHSSTSSVLPFSLGNYIGNLIGAIVLTFKAMLLVIVQIWVRWTLPRLRIDQVMTTCLKYLVPISCALFLGGVLWPLTLTSTIGRTTLFDWPAAWSEATPLRFAAAQGAGAARGRGGDWESGSTTSLIAPSPTPSLSPSSPAAEIAR